MTRTTNQGSDERASADSSVSAGGGLLRRTAKKVMPRPLFRWLKTRLRGPEETTAVGECDFGDLRRLTPISARWGYERGRPVDRYYIERFLSERSEDIHGTVLEIADNSYTVKYGGERVTASEVLHAGEGNANATIVGDLAVGDSIPSDAFDCIILTQTLFLIYDVNSAIRTIHRTLKPGGVVLVTVPGVSHKVTRYDTDRWDDYWRFTSISIRRLFEEVFPAENLEVEAHGNVLTAAAFLYGLAAEEITEEEFAYDDPDFEVSIAVRAVKPGGQA